MNQKFPERRFNISLDREESISDWKTEQWNSSNWWSKKKEWKGIKITKDTYGAILSGHRFQCRSQRGERRRKQSSREFKKRGRNTKRPIPRYIIISHKLKIGNNLKSSNRKTPFYVKMNYQQNFQQKVCRP